MATFNSSPNILNNSDKTTEPHESTATFYVPSPSPLLGYNSSSFATTSSAVENHSFIGIHKNLPNLTHHVNSSSSYTFMEIKREPCQVSEVTTSNSIQSSNRHNSKSTSSTLTTMVKIESTSPKVSEMEKLSSQINSMSRKRPQENTPAAVQAPRDMNYYGIRVADIGNVATAGCGNIYFAETDLVSGSGTEDINASLPNLNRAASTFWQYPNPFPIESVISMSPVGLQYSRDTSRGQLVLLPTTATIDSFQQAAFLWPPYIQQNPAGALQPPPNFIFPSMSPQTNTQAQQFSAPLQLLGSNYLTTAAAAATSTLCQHSQTNGNRFMSFSSTDTRKMEQSQKHSNIKIEDWNSEHNSLNKNILIPHHLHTGRIDKQKLDSESVYVETQTNTNLIGTMPTILHNPSHIVSHNTPPQTEYINMSMLPSNFIATPDTTPFNPPQMVQGVVGGVYKSSALRVSSISKTPEMQDVNIQTDTPVCSEDENSSLEVSTGESMPDRNKFVSNIQSTQCSNTYGGGKSIVKESCTDSVQMHPASNELLNENINFGVPEESCTFESEYTSESKNDGFSSNSRIVLPSADRDENLSFKTTNPLLLEMSGLELLSNISTGSFINPNSIKTVKQEPSEHLESDNFSERLSNSETYISGRDQLNTQYRHPTEENETQNPIRHPSNSSVTQSIDPPLGGLNLLCALAEQRFQEEVENNNYNNTINEHTLEVKRRKHKHSKTKSSKKSRYYKKNKKKYCKERKEHTKTSGMRPDCDEMHDNLKSVLKKTDTNYKKMSKWPNPEDFFKAMESDMRMRLADITRQYRKKKRKLDEISKIKEKKKTSLSQYKFANISCRNPNFICFLDKLQTRSSNFPPPIEPSESQEITVHTKTHCESPAEISAEYERTTRDVVNPLKFKKSTSFHNSNLTENLRCKESKEEKKKRKMLGVGKNALKVLSSNCVEPTAANIVEDPIALEIDKELVLSNEHLYRKETRVLTDMGGLFYAGILKPLQPPDVYAITLDGERGNKSHIMSREEIFKDTILEVAPKNIKNVPTGTRLCAYWSQQYRCLYPGKAIDSDTLDTASDFVSVEFDDGDSGRIRLQNIRFLLSDYPIVEYSENPLNVLGKNKRSATIKSTSTDTIFNESNRNETRNRKTDRKKKQFVNNLSSVNSSTECVHKHKKHKKRKKHKKHNRNLSPNNLTTAIDKDHEVEFIKPVKEDEQTEVSADGANNNHQKKNNTKPKKTVNTETEELIVHPLLNETLKSETIESDGEDSTLNVVSEASDEANPNEKVDYNSGKGSKIAAFLPERQLWGWLGQAYRKAGLKGRARKQFYKSITRGKETITVGECAVFLSTGRPDRPYIGRIESMWETTSSNKIVRVRWFYHPEETSGCPQLVYPGALFDSPHEDENDVQTISHRCEVIEFATYIQKFGSDIRQYQLIYDNNDTYYLSGYYNPRLQVLKVLPDVPTKENTSV